METGSEKFIHEVEAFGRVVIARDVSAALGRIEKDPNDIRVRVNLYDTEPPGKRIVLDNATAFGNDLREMLVSIGCATRICVATFTASTMLATPREDAPAEHQFTATAQRLQRQYPEGISQQEQEKVKAALSEYGEVRNGVTGIITTPWGYICASFLRDPNDHTNVVRIPWNPLASPEAVASVQQIDMIRTVITFWKQVNERRVRLEVVHTDSAGRSPTESGVKGH